MSRGLLFITTIAIALAVAGSAASRVASSGGTVPPDPAGDSGSGPDLTTLSIENDDAGKLTWHVGIGNRAALAAPDLVLVFIDADWKDTGSNGFEYLIQVDPSQGASALFKWDGSQYQDTQSTSVSSSFAAGVLEISVDFRELQSENVRFQIYSLADRSDPNSDSDEAPGGNASFAFTAKVPLLFDALTTPAKIVAGRTVSATLNAWTDGADPATGSCRIRVGTKLLPSRATSAAVTVVAPSSTGIVVTAYKSLVMCSATVPRSARGKRVTLEISATRAGASLDRSFTAVAR